MPFFYVKLYSIQARSTVRSFIIASQFTKTNIMTGFEPLISVATGALGNLISEAISTNSRGIAEKLGLTFSHKKNEKLIFQASRDYIKNYTERHGLVKVLGMREPVRLESIYTQVRFLDDKERRSFTSAEELEKIFHSQGRGFHAKNTKGTTGIEIANQKQFLMVLGDPGSGKSTFLRKMGLEALKSNQGWFIYPCMPIFIELKRFTDDDIDIKKVIVNELHICNFPEAEQITQYLLNEGKLLILLDGLDEVPTINFNKIVDAIKDFVDQYGLNRYIISCRVPAYRHNLLRFTDVVIATFNSKQIEQFICNWFHREEDLRDGTAQKCWKLLQKPENAAAKELAQTPLLLTFLCLVYDYSQNFPDSRSGLYHKALRILLEEWAAEKRIMQDKIFQGLNTELEEVLLSEIAYQQFKATRLLFHQKEIVDQIKHFLETNLNAPKHLSGETVLDTIAIQQGILVERTQSIYSFSHLTLQEYLTAQYVYDRQQMKQLVAAHLTDLRWREVFLLVSGLMRAGSGADELLIEMNQAVRDYIKTPKLKILLQWGKGLTTKLEGRIKPVAKRASVLFFALELVRICSNRAVTPILDVTVDITRSIVNAVHPDDDLFSDRNHDITLAKYLIKSLEMAVQRVRDPKCARDLTFTNYLAKYLAEAIKLAESSAQDLKRARNLDISDYTSSYHRSNSFDRTRSHALNRSEILTCANFPALVTQLKALESNFPNINQAQEIYREFARKLLQICIESFNFNKVLLNISETEGKIIEKYFYTSYLIIQCRKAAVRVSPQTWEMIETQMLLPD